MSYDDPTKLEKVYLDVKGSRTEVWLSSKAKPVAAVIKRRHVTSLSELNAYERKFALRAAELGLPVMCLFWGKLKEVRME